MNIVIDVGHKHTNKLRGEFKLFWLLWIMLTYVIAILNTQ